VLKYTNNARLHQLPISKQNLYPKLDDATEKTGFDHHYVYHTAWAARKLAEKHPESHIDIGSHHYFATLVSAFIPFEFYDYRPLDLTLSNLSLGSADLVNLWFPDSSIYSLSCMHVVEHIGLGRYGDPIDPDGDIKAMNELIRVLAPDGILYFVVPVGKPRICFNAHRIYSPTWIKDFFGNKGLRLEDFAIVTDEGNFLYNQLPENFTNQSYACGCFEFRKEKL